MEFSVSTFIKRKPQKVMSELIAISNNLNWKSSQMELIKSAVHIPLFWYKAIFVKQTLLDILYSLKSVTGNIKSVCLFYVCLFVSAAFSKSLWFLSFMVA